MRTSRSRRLISLRVEVLNLNSDLEDPRLGSGGDQYLDPVPFKGVVAAEAIILLVTALISSVVTPLISASDKVYDGTVTDMGPDGEYPVRITCRYSRRRNATRTAGLYDELTLDDLLVGMAVKWTSLSGGHALIVGPLPEDPGEEPPSPKGGIKRIVVEVENEMGESLTFELGEDDYRVEDADLEIDFRARA